MNKKVMLVALFVLVLFSMLAMAVAGRSRFPLVNRAVAAVVLPVESMLTGLGNAGDGLGAAILGKHRIARQPRVDQDHGILDFQSKAGMA